MSEQPLSAEYCMIGVDIGGTNTRIGFFSSLPIPMQVVKFPTLQSYEEQLQQLVSAIQARQIGTLVGIGVSVAARIAKDGESVVFGPNLPNYIGRPFAQELSRSLQCPVRLAHDTVCGLLGEKQYGVLQPYERSAYLTVSTGTGAAIQLGKDGIALTSSIEIGHQILDSNPFQCLCGMVGCLETYTGGRQLELRYGRSLQEIADEAFWDTFTDKLALGLVNLAQLTRIDVIAVSGAIALYRSSLIAVLQKKVETLLRGAHIQLLRARLGEDAPLVGAAALLQVPERTILH
jgi:glucokinase